MTAEQAIITQTPRYNIDENDQRLALSIALPGVAKDKIVLNTEGQTVTLSAMRETPTSEQWTLISNQVEVGSYELKLNISHEYDLALTEAKYQENVLQLIISAKASNNRSLEIQ